MVITKSFFSIFAAIFLLTTCQQSPNKAFEKAKAKNTIEAYEAFIEKYPDSPEVKEAQIALERVHLDNAIKSGEIENIRAFIIKFPQTTWIPEAEKQLEKIYSAEFEKAKKENTVEAYETLIKKYPDLPELKQAQVALERIHLDNAIKLGKIENVKAFINKFPNSSWIPEAKKRLQNIYRAEFDKAQKEDIVEAYEAFIKKYPDSPQVKEARNAIRYKSAPRVANIAGEYECDFSYSFVSTDRSVVKKFGNITSVYITQSGNYIVVDNCPGSIDENNRVTFRGAFLTNNGTQHFTGEYSIYSKTIIGSFMGVIETWEYISQVIGEFRLTKIN